ncbi:MAG TPA: GNAT family N-acetyltransferase [Mycobacteriales bacterium]|nr:GNAT family N-acetyltransferase [Mycobacteriales bacterium]
MSDRTVTDELATARLRLRPWRTSDLDAYFDMYSRWDVMCYLGSDPKVLESREEAVERLARRAVPDIDGPPYGVWAVCDSDQDRPVGTMLLKRLPWSASVQPVPESRDVEIGWHLHPDFWGRGYATEAARALLGRAAEHGIKDVRAVIYPDNAPSQAVCRRIGLEYAGRTDRYYDIELDLFCAEF